uniref:DAZ-associated protein 2 n=1 Tax=Macrostomum lignano TaxID=282301 RepID=A0A1I8FCN8_9PLAT
TSQGLYGYYGNPATAAVAAAAAAAMHFPSASYPTNAVLPTSPMGLQHQQLLAPYQMPPLPPAAAPRPQLQAPHSAMGFPDTRASCLPPLLLRWPPPVATAGINQASHFSRQNGGFCHYTVVPPPQQTGHQPAASITSTSICQPLAFITSIRSCQTPMPPRSSRLISIN